jgi:Holliday junction resolvase RusA-like endonuclease
MPRLFATFFMLRLSAASSLIDCILYSALLPFGFLSILLFLCVVMVRIYDYTIREASMIEDIVVFTVPLRPPTVNHYWADTFYTGRDGYGHRGRKLTAEAKAFKAAVAIFSQGRTVAPATDAERRKVLYRVIAHVYYGPKMRGDADNFGKAICDSLQYAGVIHSDANVDFRVVPHKDERDNPENPRVQFIVERIP